MEKRLFTTLVTHLLRGAFFVALFFIAIDMIRLAYAQAQSSTKSQANSEASGNNLHTANGTKTVVRVHDTAERTQIVSAQQN